MENKIQDKDLIGLLHWLIIGSSSTFESIISSVEFSNFPVRMHAHIYFDFDIDILIILLIMFSLFRWVWVGYLMSKFHIKLVNKNNFPFIQAIN